MKNATLIITRHGHEVEVEVTPENPGLGYVLEDTARYSETGEKKLGMLYLADDGIPLTILEEEEFRERLNEANAAHEDDDFDDDYEPLSDREQDAAAAAWFGDRARKLNRLRRE